MRAVNAIAGNWEVDVIQRVTSGFPLFVVDGTRSRCGVLLERKQSEPSRPGWRSQQSRTGCCESRLRRPDRGAHAPTLVQSMRLCSGRRWRTWKFQESSVDRAAFCRPRSLLHQAFPAALRVRLDFRAEFFNIWNHPQFYLQGGASQMQDIEAPTSFGVVNGTVKQAAGHSIRAQTDVLTTSRSFEGAGRVHSVCPEFALPSGGYVRLCSKLST